MTHTIPTRDALKTQAKALRADLGARGTPVTHSQALEMVAHQWGAHDWNTLSARASQPNAPRFAPGDPVTGAYLGHRFSGTVKAARAQSGGFWNLTIRFDAPVDVVASAHFSSFRQQVTATVNATGQTVQKTSDGVPHLSLDV